MGEGQILGHYICKRASVLLIIEQLNTRQSREAAVPLLSPGIKLCHMLFFSNGSKFLQPDMTLQASSCEQEVSSKKLWQKASSKDCAAATRKKTCKLQPRLKGKSQE